MVLMGFFKNLVKGVANLATMGAIKSYDAQKQAMQQQALYQQMAMQQQQQAMELQKQQAQPQKALQERELASQEQNLNQQSKYNISSKRENNNINNTDLTKGKADTSTNIKLGLVGDDESGDEWY